MPRYKPEVGTPLHVDVPNEGLAVTIAAFHCTVSLEDPGNATQIGTAAGSLVIQNLFLDPSVWRIKLEAGGADSSAFIHFHPPR